MPCGFSRRDERLYFNCHRGPDDDTIRAYPSRVRVRFRGKAGQAALDQIRAVDMTRLVKKLGDLPKTTADEVATVLVEMFQRE